MNKLFRIGVAKILWIVGTIAVVACGLIAWQMSFVEHVSIGRSERTFTIAVEFDEFRKIMVRQNATKAVISHAGMTLLEEKVVDIQFDTSGDSRPLINAILGRSKTNLVATKAITVRLDDPNLKAGKLFLIQRAEVKNGEMHVRTEADQPTGTLEAYSSNLDAYSENLHTSVSISISQSVRVRVPFYLKLVADRRVQAAADEASILQEQSIKDFIAEFANESIVALANEE